MAKIGFKNPGFFDPSDPKMTPFLGSKFKKIVSGVGFGPKPSPMPIFIKIGVGDRNGLYIRSLISLIFGLLNTSSSYQYSIAITKFLCEPLESPRTFESMNYSSEGGSCRQHHHLTNNEPFISVHPSPHPVSRRDSQYRGDAPTPRCPVLRRLPATPATQRSLRTHPRSLWTHPRPLWAEA